MCGCEKRCRFLRQRIAQAIQHASERDVCSSLLSLSLTDCLGRPFTRAFTLHARRERQEKQGRKGWKRIREPHHVHTREKKRFPFPFSPASGFSLSLSLEQTIASRERGFTNICFSLFLLPSSSLLSCAKTRCKAHPSASVALSHAYAHTQTHTHALIHSKMRITCIQEDR